jgi:hypothetical protein
MHLRRIGLVVLALLPISPASAMSVADFLVKAEAIRAKGMMAVFSPDLSLLKTEVQTGVKAWQAQVAPAGMTPNACPPASMDQMTPKEVMAMMNAVPPPQRATTETADALIAGLNRRYPCHG